MKRKRAVKLLMSMGIQRNEAEFCVRSCRANSDAVSTTRHFKNSLPIENAVPHVIIENCCREILPDVLIPRGSRKCILEIAMALDKWAAGNIGG